jgi:hypothetical protein
LPTPNIACSGIPVKAPLEEWTALAEGDQRLEPEFESWGGFRGSVRTDSGVSGRLAAM